MKLIGYEEHALKMSDPHSPQTHQVRQLDDQRISCRLHNSQFRELEFDISSSSSCSPLPCTYIHCVRCWRADKRCFCKIQLNLRMQSYWTVLYVANCQRFGSQSQRKRETHSLLRILCILDCQSLSYLWSGKMTSLIFKSRLMSCFN